MTTTNTLPPAPVAAAVPLGLRPVHWFREFGRPPRILGLDIARGLAVLGMAAAHVGETGSVEWLDPSTWTGLVNGRSSILFAVLAGVSIALMTGRGTLPEPERLPGIRLNLIGRGAVIFLIGLALEMVNTPIAVILTLYGLIYVAVIPFLRWKPWQLLVGAGVLAVAGPALLALITAVALQPFGAGIGFVLYGMYPITVWMALVLGGRALGRLRVETLRTAVVTLVVGVVLAVVGYGLGALGQSAGITEAPNAASWSKSADSWSTEGMTSVSGVEGAYVVGGEGDYVEPPSGWEGYPQALAESDPLGAALTALFAVEPHSGGTAEIIGSGGFALAVIGLCLLLSRPLRWLLLPLGALGSMPLTAYSGHVLVIAAFAGPGTILSSGEFWAFLALGMLLVTTLWSMFFGRGPLERLVARGAKAMASVPKR